jgi:hypothetical protein
VKYDGSSDAPTNAGTYAITADFAPTDTTNYQALNDASAGTLVISPATPSISITNSPVTYNGSAQAATVEGSVPGTVSGILYDGSATVPTAAGSYVVTANFAPDSPNYAALTGSEAGTFVIEKANPVFTITNSPVVFNGNPQAVTVTTPVAGTVSNVKYNGSATVPSAAGAYAVTVDFTPTDTTNYATLTDFAVGNFVITGTSPAISLQKTAASQTYSLVGDKVDFTYTITNTGDVALPGPFTVTDNKITTVTCPTTASLAVGASIECTGTYTVVAGDIAVTGKTVVNTATAHVTYANADLASTAATVTITYAPRRIYLPVISH